MANLSIRLLGPFGVRLNGKPLSGFVSDKVRALLAYLVTESDRAHRRETLAGLLWPDVPEASARNSLRTALVNLRTVIGDRAVNPPFLHISRAALQFNGSRDAWCDVTTFSRLLASPSSPLHGEESVQSLDQAVELYRGDFLEGLSLADSVAFEDWALIRREQFQRQVLEALYNLATFHEERRNYEQALPFAWRQVELDPWREAAWDNLGESYRALGDTARAAAAYQRAIDIVPGHEQALNNLAALRGFQGDGVAAEAGFRAAAAANPRYLPAWRNLAILLTNNQRLEEARLAWQRVLLLDPGNELAARTLQQIEAANPSI